MNLENPYEPEDRSAVRHDQYDVQVQQLNDAGEWETIHSSTGSGTNASAACWNHLRFHWPVDLYFDDWLTKHARRRDVLAGMGDRIRVVATAPRRPTYLSDIGNNDSVELTLGQMHLDAIATTIRARQRAREQLKEARAALRRAQDRRRYLDRVASDAASEAAHVGISADVITGAQRAAARLPGKTTRAKKTTPEGTDGA